ncbi:hypothetical protein BDR26DRAFT_851213 [Obelidium mucronatum]|nr:hypothetical protein BDR26DRAFT_851213 [Obelidium mucronatum]
MRNSSALDSWARAHSAALPTYKSVAASSDGAWKLTVRVGGKLFAGERWERSYGLATEEAARVALRELENRNNNNNSPHNSNSTSTNKQLQTLISKTVGLREEVKALTGKLDEAMEMISAKNSQLKFAITKGEHDQERIKTLEKRVAELEGELAEASSSGKKRKQTGEMEEPLPAYHKRQRAVETQEADDVVERARSTSSSLSTTTNSTPIAWPDLLAKIGIDYHSVLSSKVLKIRATKAVNQFASQNSITPLFTNCTIKGFVKPMLTIPKNHEDKFLDFLLSQDWMDEIKNGKSTTTASMSIPSPSLKGKSTSSANTATPSSTLKGKSTTTANSTMPSPTLSSSSSLTSSFPSSTPTINTGTPSLSTDESSASSQSTGVLEITDESSASSQSTTILEISDDEESSSSSDEDVVEVPLEKKDKSDAQKPGHAGRMQAVTKSCLGTSPAALMYAARSQTPIIPRKQIAPKSGTKPKTPIIRKNAVCFETIVAEIMPGYFGLSIEKRTAVRDGADAFLQTGPGRCFPKEPLIRQ